MSNNPTPSKSDDAFRLIAFVVLAIIIVLGVVGGGILLYFRPDANATFIGQVIQLAGILTVGAGSLFAIGRLNRTVQEVKRQTNGTLSAKEEELTRLRAEKEQWLASQPANPNATPLAQREGRLL